MKMGKIARQKTNCVYRYRRASSQHLKEETEKYREMIDEILEDIERVESL